MVSAIVLQLPQIKICFKHAKNGLQFQDCFDHLFCIETFKATKNKFLSQRKYSEKDCFSVDHGMITAFLFESTAGGV